MPSNGGSRRALATTDPRALVKHVYMQAADACWIGCVAGERPGYAITGRPSAAYSKAPATCTSAATRLEEVLAEWPLEPALCTVARLGQPDRFSPCRMAEMLRVDKIGREVRC